jgi:peroxiredoxin
MTLLQTMTSKLILLSLVVFSHLSFAESIDIGPDIGLKAPLLAALDKKGQQVSTKSLAGENGLIILFFRSADWCPFCQKHLIELNSQADALKSLGYGLAAISYDDINVLQEFSNKHKIIYPLLSDIDAKTMINYGILNKQYNKRSEHYGIPYPGVVVINKQGEITHKHFFEGYKKRVKLTELYQNLKTL